MKNLLGRLEKSRDFWSLLIISLFFFLLRLPSLIEPNWYGDEGIYQIIGMALRHGRILYTGIWDNKPPLLYLIYALFDGSQFWVRLFSLLVGIITVIAFYFLSRDLFRRWSTTLWTTALLAFLFAVPFLEGNIANAENFMLLPAIAAGLILLHTLRKKNLHPVLQFLAGILLGLSFITKVVAVFDVGAFLAFIYLLSVQDKHLGRLTYIGAFVEVLRRYWLFIAGFLLPLLVTCFYFLAVHAFTPFINATFFSNIGYVGYGNAFLFPQGLLVLKLILLGGFLAFLFVRRNEYSTSSLFILTWLGFSVFNAFFSQRPYTHYVLVLLPSFALFLGWIFTSDNTFGKVSRGVLGLLLLGIVLANFNIYSPSRVMSYYTNFVSFISGRKSVTNYRAYFDKGTPAIYDLALFIKSHTTKKDSVFVWGNSAQIYVLSGKLPPGRFTVAYHITGNDERIRETAEAITKAKPLYVIVLNNVPYLPFQLVGYQQKYQTDNALIYERTD